MQRFRGGLVFKDNRLCVSRNSRLESNKEEGRTVETARVGMVARLSEASERSMSYAKARLPIHDSLDIFVCGRGADRG